MKKKAGKGSASGRYEFVVEMEGKKVVKKFGKVSQCEFGSRLANGQCLDCEGRGLYLEMSFEGLRKTNYGMLV